MNTTEPEPLEERYTSLLAAAEQALWSPRAAGTTLSIFDSDELPPEVQVDLERDLACVELLRQVLPLQLGGTPGVLDGRANEKVMELPRPSKTQGVPPSGVPLSEEAPPTLPWTSLGRFQIRRELGRGNFGIVYLAHDPGLNREVALKVPRVNALADPQLRERFQREARSAAALDHPNLVPVYEAGEVGPVCFIASAYCPGITLATWLKEGDKPVPYRTAAALVAQVADGVDHAHRHGVVHRDLKPGNILLSDECRVMSDESKNKIGIPHSSLITSHDSSLIPKITDFGLAKFFLGEEEASQTRSGALVGTPSYMAPEQAEGWRKELGPAVDIYALGVILYELLTGRPPFQAESVLETLLLVRKEEPLRPGRLRRRLPRDLETICLKCLEKEPHKRYASAAALAADLRRFLAGEPIQARPISSWERGLKWARRRPAVAALLALFLFTGAIGFAGITWQWQRAEKAADDLEVNLYFKNVALAQSQWSVNNFVRAEQLLEACPERLRGWEWHYVEHLRYGPPTTFPEHSGIIYSVAFSPDNRLIAYGMDDRTVKVRESKTGRLLQTFSDHEDHEDMVRSVAFFPDSRRLASASGKWVSGGAGKIIVWDTKTRAKLIDIVRPQTIRALAVSGDGQRLASAEWGPDSPGKDSGTLMIWDAATGAELHRIVTAPYANSLAFSPDGGRIALGCGSLTSVGDGTVFVWDATTGAALLALRNRTGGCFGVAFSPDGKLLASAGGLYRADEGEVKIWDALSGRLIRTLPGHAAQVACVAFSPDSRRLASAGRDKQIKIWDVASGVEALTLHGHSDTVWSLSFSSDGHRLVSSSADETVRVWDATPLDDAEQGEARATLPGQVGRVNGLAYSPDGRYLATAGSDKTVRVWDANTWKELHVFADHTGLIMSVAFSPDSRLLASASEDETVRIWDVASGQALFTFRGHSRVVESVSFSSDGRVASVGWDRTVRIWDPRTGKEFIVNSNASTFKIESVAFSPDGRYVATASSDCTVKVWDSQTVDRPKYDLGRQNGRVLCVAFSPDGKRLAFCGLNQTATVYDLDAKKVIVTFREHTDQVNCVAFSPDGRRIASASHDATIKIWKADTGEEVKTFRGHTRWVNSVAFSPDGKQLASAGADGSVKIWDAPP